jgi:signal peptidase
MMAFLVVSSKASGGEPQAFGYQLKSVLSGSMEPTFKTGSVIGVKPLVENEKKNLKVDDIITYQDGPEKLTTHRIVGVIESGDNILYETRGDNNKSKDLTPVLSDNVVAKYSGFTIPYLGYFIDFSKSPAGSAMLLIIPGIFLIGYAGFSIYQTIREIDSKTKKSASNEETV